MRIKIGPFWIKVMFVPMPDEDGYCDYAALTIYINSNIEPQLQRETLLHEIQHVCSFIIGKPLLAEDEEKFIRPTAGILFGALVENTNLVEFLLKGIVWDTADGGSPF